MDFPPVLLEPEEWIFSNDINMLLKDLMQFDQKKMKIVQAAFNPESSKILRPDKLIAWKVKNFPEEWNALTCDFFVPEGHLTQVVLDQVRINKKKPDASTIEEAFLQCMENSIDTMGYLLFKPAGSSKYAGIKKYLSVWETDDREAGVL